MQNWCQESNVGYIGYPQNEIRTYSEKVWTDRLMTYSTRSTVG